MSVTHRKWEWSGEEIRRVGYRVVDIIAEHLTGLPERPVFRPVPEDLARSFLSEPVPQTGREPDEILDAFLASVEPYPFGNGHPRFFGWVNSPPARDDRPGTRVGDSACRVAEEPSALRGV